MMRLVCDNERKNKRKKEEKICGYKVTNMQIQKTPEINEIEKLSSWSKLCHLNSCKNK